MSVAELRSELIQWLRGIDDEELLRMIANFKDAVIEADWYADLSDQQKEQIEQGILDHKNGNVVSSAEFWARHGR